MLVNPGRAWNEVIFLTRLTDDGLRATSTWAAQAGGPHNTGAFALTGNGRCLYLGGMALDSAQLGPARVRMSNWKQRAFVAELALPE
jgi:hypothetical protein